MPASGKVKPVCCITGQRKRSGEERAWKKHDALLLADLPLDSTEAVLEWQQRKLEHDDAAVSSNELG